MTVYYQTIQGEYAPANFLLGGRSTTLAILNGANSWNEDDTVTTIAGNMDDHLVVDNSNAFWARSMNSISPYVEIGQISYDVDTGLYSITEITSPGPTFNSSTRAICFSRDSNSFFAIEQSSGDIEVYSRSGTTFTLENTYAAGADQAEDTICYCPAADLLVCGGGDNGSSDYLKLFTHDTSLDTLTDVTSTNIDFQPPGGFAIPSSGLKWSPDGTYLAVVCPGFSSGFYVSVYTRSGNSLTRTNLVNSSGLTGGLFDGACVWSSDSKYLYVVNNETGSSPLTYGWDATNSFSSITLTTDINRDSDHLAFHEDTYRIIGSNSTTGTAWRTYIVDSADGDITSTGSSITSTSASEQGMIATNFPINP